MDLSCRHRLAAAAVALAFSTLLGTPAAAGAAEATGSAAALLPEPPPAAVAGTEAPQPGPVPLGTLPGYDAAKAAAAGLGLAAPSPLLPQAELPAPAPPAICREFAGPSFTGWYPPDPIIAAGPNQVVVLVNEKIAVYGKTGIAVGTARQLYAFFGRPSTITASGGIFDPKVAYDPWGKRFVIVALETDRSTYSYYHVAVSKTSTASTDPAKWWRYRLDGRRNGSTTSATWADYPGLGFDSAGAIFLTSNQFTTSTQDFAYARLRVLRKSQLYNGASTVTWKDFWNLKNADGSTAFTLQPVQQLSTASRQWLVNTAAGGGSRVTLWRVTNTTSSSPVLARQASVAVQPYAIPPDAAQLGGPALVHTGDCRLLNAVYANGTIWTTFTHANDFSADGDTESAVRWLGISPTTGLATTDYVYGQEDTFLFWPGIGADNRGSTYLVFGKSDLTTHPGAYFAGWRSTSPVPSAIGELHPGQVYYDLGAGPPPGTGRVRWGDYAGIARDPSLGTVWIFHEYSVPGPYWATRIARIGI